MAKETHTKLMLVDTSRNISEFLDVEGWTIDSRIGYPAEVTITAKAYIDGSNKITLNNLLGLC